MHPCALLDPLPLSFHFAPMANAWPGASAACFASDSWHRLASFTILPLFTLRPCPRQPKNVSMVSLTCLIPWHRDASRLANTNHCCSPCCNPCHQIATTTNICSRWSKRPYVMFLNAFENEGMRAQLAKHNAVFILVIGHNLNGRNVRPG
jgi:hypothetical protein